MSGSASPVLALRDAFGDPKPPEISRKITACVACRKQKIKCHMRDSKPPCIRCKKRGLSCTVNKSLQMLLESDVSWKHTMEARMRKLEESVKNIPSQKGIPESHQKIASDDEDAPQGETLQDDAGNDSAIAEERIAMDLETGPGALPSFHLAESVAGPRTNAYLDIIDRGLITLEKGKSYFDVYQNRLDHFTYRVLSDNCSFEQIRRTSPLLTAAVCTVGALHLSSDEFDICYQEFLTLSAAQSFSKKNTTDDVRALLIGAFWLFDAASALVGAAVRISLGLDLHKSFSKANNRAHYLRSRLYFLVYACDHQVSVGKPPMTRECEVIRNARKFLTCMHATEDDARLVSQVCRWSLFSNILDAFGFDIDRPLSDLELPHLEGFSISLDNLRAEWADRFLANPHVGNYPSKGVGLQYYFVRLYLCSHAFRGHGIIQDESRSPETIAILSKTADSAVSSALSILQIIETDVEVQSFLNGLPVYFHTMIAFAAVFLLKMLTRFAS